MVKMLSGFGQGSYEVGERADDVDHHEVSPWFPNPLFPDVTCTFHHLSNSPGRLYHCYALDLCHIPKNSLQELASNVSRKVLHKSTNA